MKLRVALGAAAALVLLSGVTQVRAAGTLADTDISNTATVDFTVGGLNQPDVLSTVTFETDRRVNLAVSEFGGAYTDVTPGQTERVLRFSVFNSTNDTMDFRLTATNDGLGVGDPFGGFDDFDPNTVDVFVDNGDDTFVAVDDTGAFIDELAPDTGVTVFIVANIQGGLTDQQTAGLTLTAYGAVAGTGGALGADYTEDGGADNATVVETVFGDPAGDAGDVAGDGFHSDDDAFRALSATITATKTTTVISDPINGTTDQKRIPGAVVEYCVVISNTGGQQATGVVISDDLAGQPVTYVPGSLIAGGAADCTGGAGEDDDAAGVDEAPVGASFSGTVATFSVGTIGPAGTTSVRFQVTINN